jgi:hypothetical protein
MDNHEEITVVFSAVVLYNKNIIKSGFLKAKFKGVFSAPLFPHYD